VPTTLIGQVERVTFENEETSFRVLRVGSLENVPFPGPITVVGTLPAVGPGNRVRLTGEFVKDARHGEQFRADTLVPLEPATLVGLEKYLGSSVIPGVGPGLAKRIVERFGMDSLQVLDGDPGRLREISGIGPRRIEEIKKTWSEKRATSNVMVLLQTHGASPSLAARIVKRYGDRAASVVQRSPYRLALEVWGVGFKTADRIAHSLGIAGDHPERIQAGVLHELGALADQGHIAVPRASLVERAAAMLEVDVAHVESAIDALWAGEHVVVEDGTVFLARLHAAECAVARGASRLLSAPGHELFGLQGALTSFERTTGITLAPAQRAAVEAAAKHKVLVITGGPGVGKTTIVRAILGVFGKARLEVRLAAPTGRAAKRMAEATGHEASTIHRLLEFDPRSGAFQRHAGHPLEGDALIVDEASMIDVPLAAALFAAMPSAARLVIVGDADQLPSVGPGAFLRDLIASGSVPVVRLTEIFRQAEQSRIVRNAHRILRGEMPESGGADETADFFVVPRRDPEQAAALVCELASSRIPRRFGFDPKADVQVLTPMHRGAAGTIALNRRLQELLNPQGAAIEFKGSKLRVGDKVMQTKNDYEREVFNGDVGVISRIVPFERKVMVELDGRQVEYEESDLDALVLAYATSIHKSQGSEYPAVVIPMLTTHFVMLNQNLLYTAVTRAKKLCVLVADPRAIGLALSERRREERSTRLVERLRAAIG
jgi:exodeoxyribonuclease V alpha subunit